MVRVICDLVFELVCLIGLIVLRFTDEITLYQFLMGLMVYYGLQRFLSFTIDLDVSLEDVHEWEIYMYEM